MKTLSKNQQDIIRHLHMARLLGVLTDRESLSIHSLININAITSLDEQLEREIKIRNKHNSCLRVALFLMKNSVSWWNRKKSKQYDRILKINGELMTTLRNQISKEDRISNRLDKEYKKIEKGINKRVK